MTLIKYCEDGIRHVDYWSVLKVINDHEVTYRLLSSTVDDDVFDRWRLNSGIIDFTLEQGFVDFHGYSGSVYLFCEMNRKFGVCVQARKFI